VQKRSMNSKGHGMMVALVILATRGPLRRSEAYEVGKRLEG
jgi:hypothetical protein